MVISNQSQVRNSVSIWLQASRPFAYSASVIPVLVGALIALAYFPGEINWALFPVAMIAGVMFHAGTNMISDYFDFRNGLDTKDSFGGSRVLVENLMEPRKLFIGGNICFAVGLALGIILIIYRGETILLLGIIGLLGGWFYSGSPFGFKDVALGDFLVFTLMGPLMVIGSYFTVTGDFNMNVLYISLPVGFLVAAILHSNNLRDTMHDRKTKVKTMAMITGLMGAKTEYFALVIGAYVSVVVMVFTGTLAPWALLVFISVPQAVGNLKEIAAARIESPEKIAMIDAKTAQHHMAFGLLLSLALVLTKLV